MQNESSAGASLQLSAIDSLASAAAVGRVREQLLDVLTRKLPLALTVGSFGPAREAEATLDRLFALLGSAIREAGAAASSISIVIDASLLSPQAIWLKRNEALGPGPVYLLVGNLLMRQSQEQFWSQCWGLRNSGQVRVAVAEMVSSPCPLLPPEVACGILPPSGLQVPPGTAWVPMQVDLTDFVNGSGDLNAGDLRIKLQRCIEFGELVHDAAIWPTAAMRHDAWLNRRLAISVTGIGDLAKLRGLDPGCFQALTNLGEVMQEVRDVVDLYSRQLASMTEPAPSLGLSSVCHGPDWQARWHAALEFAAIRHRNLLAMSPWSLFPSGGGADSRYCDLLPLLQHADVCSFPPPPCLKQWNINEFKHFHRRAWAVLEQKDARQLFAERV